MTTTTSLAYGRTAPRPAGSSAFAQARLHAAKVNGGAACAEPRGNGRYTVTGRSGARYTVLVLSLDAIFCDCASSHYRGPNACWHAACAYLRAVADGMVAR